MIIGAVFGSIGVLVAIIITVTCLLVLFHQQRIRKMRYIISSHPDTELSMTFQPTEESTQYHEIKNVTETNNFFNFKDSPTGAMKRSDTQSAEILDAESLAKEDAEAKATIHDKQVCTLYYCGNWQA